MQETSRSSRIPCQRPLIHKYSSVNVALKANYDLRRHLYVGVAWHSTCLPSLNPIFPFTSPFSTRPNVSALKTEQADNRDRPSEMPSCIESASRAKKDAQG